jgi:hypothetical protein
VRGYSRDCSGRPRSGELVNDFCDGALSGPGTRFQSGARAGNRPSVFTEFGFDYVGTFTMSYSGRHLDNIIDLLFDRTDSAESLRVYPARIVIAAEG